MNTNFITKNWRGEYPLVISYWAFFVLLGNLVGIAFVAVLVTSSPSALFILAGVLLQVGLLVWTSVGVWRSAGIYKIHKPDKGHWSALAKLFVALAWAISLKDIFMG